MSSGSLQPTWFGHVTTARDALVLFEACLNGTLHHVPRRPHDRERSQLIKSGCVFIYEENASGIKRWTDGVPWSPSRILGNFLVYRELVKPFPPGEKKKANKRNKRMTKPGEPYPRSGSGDAPLSPTTPVRSDVGAENRENERALIGSLVDSYGFKEGGLVKKTMSVTVHGVQHHLVSYYKIEDALDGTLSPPSKDPRLASTEPRPDLVARQNFRAPLDDIEDGSDQMSNGTANGYGYASNGYRTGLVMNTPGHPHHPGQLGLSIYPGMAYSSAAHMQPSMQSYAPISTQSYYPPTSAVTHPIITKQEDYGGYGQAYHSHANSPATPSDRPTSLPSPHQSQASYSYRQSPVGGSLPRSNGLLDTPVSATDHKPSQSPGWGRSTSMNGVYAPTAAPTSNPSPSYTNGNSQWGLVGTSGTSLPRPESMWANSSAASSHWNVQNHPMTPRHNSYQSTAAHHH